jgi:chromosome segregation ATPase
MKKNEELTLLKQLLADIELAESLEKKVRSAAEKKEKASQCQPKALAEFDEENLEAYVASRLGAQPVKPKFGIAYRARKTEYEQALAEYQQRDSDLRQQYYRDYEETRRKLEDREKEKIAADLAKAEEKLTELNSQLEEIRNKLNENDILSSRLKNRRTVSTLIGYFEDRRVDTIKEAVNLMFEEQHRRKMEEDITKLEENVTQLQQQTHTIVSQIKRNEDKLNSVARKADILSRDLANIKWNINSN